MSQLIRSRGRNNGPKRRQSFRIEPLQRLEEKQLLAPFLTTETRIAEFEQDDDLSNDDLTIGSVSLTFGTDDSNFSAAPFVSVSQLTPISSFGGDIVNLEAGPGGDFGNVLYAISRGSNTASPVASGGNPGVIYRVDPATGESSVFFDLNTVIDQIDPGNDASNSAGAATGLVNFYDMAFDVEGVFDGLPSLFVSSVDNDDPLNNAVYRIAPDGTFLGVYLVFTEGAPVELERRPSAILVPPARQQDFLRGLFVGSGTNAANDIFSSPGFPGIPAFSALFFDANESVGAQAIETGPLPEGVDITPLNLGPQVGFASANSNYESMVYSAFTDFGEPGIIGFSDADPGPSGIQGLGGEFLIQDNSGATTLIDPIGDFLIAGDDADDDVILGAAQADADNPSGLDRFSALDTPYRRFYDIAFDEFGYFSYGAAVSDPADGPPVITGPQQFAGSVFVSDLATGLSVAVPLPANAGDGSAIIPVQSAGGAAVSVDPVTGELISIFPGGNLGGRIVRVLPDGTVTPFAEGFNTSGLLDSGSFIESSLSITFSADGTTLYASDNDGIWQFKSTLSLAGSTTGSVTGLNDLRSLGVPFDGSDTAVAVIDTGVDGATPPLRDRVAPGTNIFTGGPGDVDLADGTDLDGHGTNVAGVVAQFVPETTIVPVTTFDPLGGGTTSQALFKALGYVADNPFVLDPVRPGVVDRIITTTIGFGTPETFLNEGEAFQDNRQLVIALKNQTQRLRHLGITTVAAAGQTVGGGDVNGESLPAVLNEVISVTGSYPFPFQTGPTATPNDPPIGPLGPFFGPFSIPPNDGLTFPDLTTADTLIFQDRLLAAANRTYVTDFVAPAVDVPTFSRTFIGDNDENLVFDQVGTSLSAGIVTGGFTMLASALDFYSDVATRGETIHAYLNVPVGTTSLNFGPGTIRTLEAYANPDGINSILHWTAVPAKDADIPNDDPVTQPFSLARTTEFRDFSRIDVGNAVAAIEGSIALSYLFTTGTINLIDTNNNGFITAQEIQNFVDISESAGLAEAGAMARLLGGTDRIPGEDPIEGGTDFLTPSIQTGDAPTGLTTQFEQPDQPDVLQRRFNFFDFAADGNLDGIVSIQQFEMLAHTLLPPPDSFTVIDRQRGSAGGFLVDGDPVRNYADLQRVLPTFAFVPFQTNLRFRNISPNGFGINAGIGPNEPGFSPTFTLFETTGGSGTNARTPLGSALSTPTVTTTQQPTAVPAQSTASDDLPSQLADRLVSTVDPTALENSTILVDATGDDTDLDPSEALEELFAGMSPSEALALFRALARAN